MNEHLDNERISRNLLGDAASDDGPDADRAHLAVCAVCRGRVEEFENALRGMRGAVHRWSDAEYAAGAARAPRPIARPVLAAAWSLGIVLCAFLLRPAPAPPPMVAEGVDTELMDQVRDDLARPVPRGMEPLLP